MARQTKTQVDDDYSARPIRKKRRFKRRYFLLAFVLLIVASIGIGIPYVASNRSLVVSLANRFAGVAPNKIDLDKIQASWFSPIRVEGFRLLDERGGARYKSVQSKPRRGSLDSQWTPRISVRS